jgi:hypothetical protein
VTAGLVQRGLRARKRAELPDTVDDAGQIGVGQFGLAQNQPAQLLMAFRV